MRQFRKNIWLPIRFHLLWEHYILHRIQTRKLGHGNAYLTILFNNYIHYIWMLIVNLKN